MTPSFTCPRCGQKSFNPKDVLHGYCGFCHDFTRAQVVDYLDIMPLGRHREWPQTKEEMERLNEIVRQSGVRILPWKGENLYRTVHEKEPPPDKTFTLEEIVELCKAYIEMKKDS